MASRRPSARSSLLIRSALATLALLAGGAAHALSPPTVSIGSSAPGRVAVTLIDGVGASGYNVYLDGEYRTTVRPSPGTGRFEIDGPSGTYCIVAFRGAGADTEYSPSSPGAAASSRR